MFDSVDGGDIGMVDRREDLRFPFETKHAGGIVRKRLGQHLDGDVAIQLRVGGAVYGAHAAFAELGHDPVMCD
jgi:hypothetical protein